MKECPNCKKKVENDAKTCAFCGFSFENNDAEELSVGGGELSMTEAESETGDQQASQPAPEQYTSRIRRKVIFHNILFYFGFARMIVFSAIFTVFCAVAIWFFAGQRIRFLNVNDLRTSCTFMIIVFSIFTAIGLLFLTVSIVQNIKKRKAKKTDSN